MIKKLNRDLSKSIINHLNFSTLFLLIFMLLAGCSSDNSVNSEDNNNNSQRGFRAKLFVNGNLMTDKFIQGIATLDDPSKDASIKIESNAEGYRIHLHIYNRQGNGIQGMSPGSLVSFGNFFSLCCLENRVSGFIESPNLLIDEVNETEVIGNISGEITKVSGTEVIGKLNASGKNNSWEIRDCEFNLKITSN